MSLPISTSESIKVEGSGIPVQCPRMRTVIETPTYLNSIASIWTTDESEEFIAFIAEHPEVGDLMPGTRGLRKVRWAGHG